MPDWTSSMKQTFEYYVVESGTWKDKARIENVRSSSITRDSDTDTLGSATVDAKDALGECYIRIYLITIQNGIKEKHPLGTFLIQTPSTKYDGGVTSVSMDAYTPLLELKENQPPIGYYVAKGEKIMDAVGRLTRDHLRAPVVETTDAETLSSDFVANSDDTWLSFIKDLAANAKYSLDLDELGRVIYPPIQEIEKLQPVWTYTDDNSSILYSDVTVDHDLYGIPNVVEVMYSDTFDYYYCRVVNDDPNSPVSTVNRGREIIYRDTNPSVIGYATNSQIEDYANNLLKNLSSIEYTISYTHGYCPVRVGDCVRLNYTKAGINNIKAKVISQTIKCEPGCPVTEKAAFTVNLWR